MTVDQTYTYEQLKVAKPTDDIQTVGRGYKPPTNAASSNAVHFAVFYNRTDGKLYIDTTDNATPVVQ